MRRVLSALSLLVFCSTVAAAQPTKRPRKASRRVARPEATVRPGLIDFIWKRLTGGIYTFDDVASEPPPPPDRVHGPIP